MLKIISAQCDKKWTLKFASITFSIADSHRIAQPKGLFDISWRLKEWEWAGNIPQELIPQNFSDNIDIDGFADSSSPTGVINWYVDKNVSEEQVAPYIEQAIASELEPLGITARIRKFEPSKMYNHLNVFRIEVTGNKTRSLEKFPELNVSNDNGYTLMREFLEIQPEQFGKIDANELLSKIETARMRIGFPQESEEISDTELETGDENPSLIQQIQNIRSNESESERVTRYLDTLQQMAEIAIKQFPNPVISWS